MKLPIRLLNTITCFILIATCGTSLFSDVFDHLKKAEGKGENHSMKNVDFIYVINLDKRPEKYEMTAKQLQQYGINPYRFSAVNGWELSLDEINDIGIRYNPNTMKNNLMATTYDASFAPSIPHHEIMNVPSRTYFCHTMSRGAIGIILSHLSIIQDAYDSGYSTIWVMEDDIEIIKNPNKISKMISKLDRTVGAKKWDMLFTDRDTKGQDGKYIMCLSYALRPNWDPIDPTRFQKRQEIRADFIKIGARYGAYSFILRRSGMKKLLNFFKTYGVFLPFDMEFYLPEGINIYTVQDDIVSTIPQALSDNGAPRYQQNQ